MRAVHRVGAALAVLSVAVCARERQPTESFANLVSSPPKTHIAFADVQPLLETLRPYLPPELTGKRTPELESGWHDWVRAHDIQIRARVARGDEDSLVNLWLFGTSFTRLPPTRPHDVALHGGGATLAQVAEGRLDELLTALASPGSNARLLVARQILNAKQIDPATATGRKHARELLIDVRDRMVSENANYGRALREAKTITDPVTEMTAYASLYRDRGLSSDTSLLSSFAIDAMLESLKASKMIGSRPIRRVAIIGPGLDFINKADGNDFYPEQTIQPFAVIDSLFRLGLSSGTDLVVTTFDVSPRVNQHVTSAVDRAKAGNGYIVQLPLSDGERWTSAFVRYWERAGGRIGETAPASRPPTTSNMKVRAVHVRPAVVASIIARDLNIVVERLEPLRDEELFDLIIATNVFAYYDRFDQALATVNAGKMLRPGGSLLSNQAVLPVAPIKAAVGHDRIAYSDRQFDHVFWYQRQ